MQVLRPSGKTSTSIEFQGDIKMLHEVSFVDKLIRIEEKAFPVVFQSEASLMSFLTKSPECLDLHFLFWMFHLYINTCQVSYFRWRHISILNEAFELQDDCFRKSLEGNEWHWGSHKMFITWTVTCCLKSHFVTHLSFLTNCIYPLTEKYYLLTLLSTSA